MIMNGDTGAGTQRPVERMNSSPSAALMGRASASSFDSDAHDHEHLSDRPLC